jgi:formylglycine-generating enzyme required for sulfatase activity
MEDYDLDRIARHKKNSFDGYYSTGTQDPDGNGVYDMLGNVAEWTMDQYIPDYYSSSEKENPWAYPTKLYPRVLRGGSWKDAPSKCQCSVRRGSRAKWKRIDPQLPKSRWWHTNAPFVGIRLVRPQVTPSSEEIKKYWLEPIDDY